MGFIINDIDQSVKDLLNQYEVADHITPQIFLDTIIPAMKVGNRPGPSNWERIQRLYTSDDILTENQSKYPSDQVLVPNGAVLYLPPSNIDRDVERKAIDDDDVIAIAEYKPFMAQRLSDLLNDPSYVRKTLNDDSGTVAVRTEYNEALCYIWCRTVNDWIDVTPYISSVTTSMSKDGGSFNITFDDVTCSYSTDAGWFPDNDDRYNVNSPMQFDKRGNSSRNNFYCNIILSENDLVFIRLERLEIDTNLTENISPVGKVWDMIGLIDSTSSTHSPSQITTTIQGRDLTKVLIEDGSIFFTSQFMGNIFVDPTTLLAKRNLFTLIEQELVYAYATFKSIPVLIKYIVNKYSNLGIIPNEALSVYGESLIKDKYDLQTNKQSKKQSGDVIDLLNNDLLSGERQGVWRLIDFIFDPEPSKRLVFDPSFSQDNGSVINSIKKICQYPFIEFHGDTYGDTYTFTVRKPPFDEQGVKGMIYGNVSTELDAPATGSGTTSNDVKRNVKSKTKTRATDRPSTLSSLVIDIDDSDVLSTNFKYHSEAYSWYRLIPSGFGKLDEQGQFLLAPIIAFDEYAAIFGSRTYSLEYNYTPALLLEDSKSESQYKYAEAQTFLDLQYMIQSNMYLPFARMGMISLVGDRTIKRGMFVYLKSSQEIFYVDEVIHTRTISSQKGGNVRVTNLKVSRGLRESYIKGRVHEFDGKPELVSYFTLINTQIDSTASINSKDVLKNWKVNSNVFNFFVQSREWVD
jgi:hypothetical protein